MISGNITAHIQVKHVLITNSIGERAYRWDDVAEMTGWLDLVNGDSKYAPHNAKIQESSHLFIGDYIQLGGVTSENSRILIDGVAYDVMLIDDPMNMHQHLEIYLKFTGGQDG